MHRKPSDEFPIVQRHLQVLGSLFIILVGKNGLYRAYVEYPVVGDGHFVGISSHIFEHGLGVAEGPLGIDHPFILEQCIDEFFFRLDPGLKGFYVMLEIINEAERLRQHIEKIDTSHIEFTADGNKFIWKEPAVPFLQKQ